MNTNEQSDRNYPVLRTIELSPEMSVTGFICGGFTKDKELHRKEFPGLYEYNLKLSDADGDLRWKQVNTDAYEQKKPYNTLFFSTVPLPLFDAEVNSRKFEAHPIRNIHVPTREEMQNFMRFPQIKEAVSKFEYFPYDVRGERIPTTEEWNRLSEEERKLRSQTITAQVSNQDGQAYSIDYNLQEPLQRILNAGFRTGQSDSGTVSDHPGYRYVEDSKRGSYRAGDLIKPGGSYLTFWKPEAKFFPNNSAEQINHIVTQAKATGWRVQEMDIFFEPSIRICLPETRDECTHQELLKEANEIIKERYPELNFSENLYEWLDIRDEIIPEVIEQHGGRVEWTDEMVMQRWTELSNRLEWVARIEESTGWLTGNDVHSVLLTHKENKALEEEHNQNRTEIAMTGKVGMDIYHRQTARIHEATARKYGFASYEENAEGTGVRNYTALGKRANKETQQRLDAYSEEVMKLLEPHSRIAHIRNERIEAMMKNAAQEHLQKIHAITQPRLIAKETARLRQRISDVSVFPIHGYAPYLYKIRCKIDGEQQPGKLMHTSDAGKDLTESQKIRLAAMYFKEELEEEHREMKTGIRM